MKDLKQAGTTTAGGCMNTARDFGVPISLLLFGVLGKWLVRKNWSLALWFMGPDLVLAGLGSDLGHFLDFGGVFLFGGTMVGQTELRRAGLGLLWTGVYVVCSMGIYLVVLKIHQNFEPSSDEGHAATSRVADPGILAQFLWLVLFSNLLGVGSMAAVVYMLRRL